MAFWDNWFSAPQQVAQISPKTQTITQTPAFQQAWPGWTSDYKTSTPYPGAQATTPPPSTTSPWGITSAGGWDVPSQGGDIYPFNPLGRTETGITESGAMTDYQRAMIELQLKQLSETTGMSEEELALRRQQMEADIANQNAQLAWSKEQWGQQQAMEQKNYLSNLAAQPHSWLEYAAASGQAPVIQPWMLPLMPQDYNISAGQTIPGWNPTNMTGMPQLTNPSAQYSARMGPTAQQQYYGYEQALTGANPEESQWRLWSMAPPSGGRGLTQIR